MRRALIPIVLGVAVFAVAPVRADDVLALSSDLQVQVRDGSRIELEVRLSAGEGYAAIARRVTGDAGNAEAIRFWNGDAEPAVDGWVRVPLALLDPDYRALVLRSLFPRDRLDGSDWVHVAREGVLPTYTEGLWQVAEWFTGRGDHFTRLQTANGLSSPELARGQEVRISAELLHASLGVRTRSDDGALEYGTDDLGPYAGYRLKPGEALYSSVVVRFTGRDSAEDVRALAAEICERSGIKDERDIPAGYLVKLRLEILEPEFLPPGHPRRVEAESARAELAREIERRPVAETRGGLEGVLIVLDPGHGGRDLGTMNNGIWEHDYVYDVTCRLKRLLETETSARVVMTLEDRQTGCAPSKSDVLRANKQGSIMTDPPFLAKADGEARIGVNLRWYLANSVYRSARKNGTAADRVLFLSIHADSRHPSLRGAMVYVPGAAYRKGTYRHNTKTYRKYREVREKPEVSFSYKQRVRSEAVSTELAKSLVGALRRHDLPVQKHKPIRSRVIRGKKAWVPAVIRGNAIPTKVLIELVNLSNRQDAKLLAAAKARQQMAEALLDGVFDHFGEKRPPKPRPTRAAR